MADSAVEVLKRVVSLPRTFRDVQTMSMPQLLRASGYPGVEAQLTVEAIANALRQQPESVEDWLRLSEDNRGTPWWYFIKSGAGYEVAFLDKKAKATKRETYTDPSLACANFIQKHLELWMIP